MADLLELESEANNLLLETGIGTDQLELEDVPTAVPSGYFLGPQIGPKIG